MKMIWKSGPFAVVLVVFSLLSFFALPAVAQENAGSFPSLKGVERVELVPGEMERFSAVGLRRVLVDDEGIVFPSATGDGRILFLAGRQVGETKVELFYEGEESSRQVMVVVHERARELQGDVVLESGEEARFVAAGIIRASVADSGVATVDMSEDGEALVVRGLVPGETFLHLYERDAREPGSFRIVVESGQ